MNLTSTTHPAYDFIIVGAGIIGANTAYALNKAFPGKEILLLDQAMAGSGTSFYSLALDFPLGQTAAKT
jgi:glycine/D-amino acid oxidase-like deaminating enzyme